MSQESLGPSEPYQPGITIDRHIMERQRKIPAATGELTGLLQQIALAGKIIASKVHRAGLAGVLGLTGDVNVQGEEVQLLDQFANDTLISCVRGGGYVCVMGSEEVADPIAVPAEYRRGKYVLLFDPLDGSGNIDINASIGTIFSIYRRKSPGSGPGTLEDLMQPGREIVCAGYVIYGSSNMMVYTTGIGVHGFTLDPAIGEFFLSHPDIRIPDRGTIYSVNEGYYSRWSEPMRKWVDWIKAPGTDGRPYSMRYIGAMVADFHRTLLRGGIFAYPADSKNKNGKLRLLYEAAPMAFIADASGGAASTGTQRVRDVIPTELHQRVPLFIGSRSDVRDAVEMIHGKSVLGTAV